MVEITTSMFKHISKREKKRIDYLYFILDKDQNAVKIGISQNPQGRLEGLRTTNLNELELLIFVVFPRKNIRKVEKDFHTLFKKYLIRNEWFRYNLNIETAIKTLRETNTEANKKVKGQRTNE